MPRDEVDVRRHASSRLEEQLKIAIAGTSGSYDQQALLLGSINSGWRFGRRRAWRSWSRGVARAAVSWAERSRAARGEAGLEVAVADEATG